MYNYRTVRVAPWAISWKSTLKDISFADCSSNTAGTNAYAWISIDLADECFADNSNLEGVYMKYKMYAGDDPQLKMEFKEWCDENNYRERTAFLEYCHESLSRHDEIFDSLSDYDE